MTSDYRDLDRPPLSGGAVARAVVRPGSLWTEVRVVPQTASSNVDVIAAADGGQAEGLVVVAELQTGGKGRQGRTWVSPRQSGVTFSVLLRPTTARSSWGWVPLLAGTSVARTLGRVAEVDAVLKWPNDVLVGPARHKVAGLLAEVSGDALVLGVGLNVSTRRDELPRDDATSLLLAGATCTDRTTLLVAVLRALAQDYRGWLAGADARPAYLAASATIGRPVRISLPAGRELVGEAVDVDDLGRLVVVDGAGVRTAVAAGDVTHAASQPVMRSPAE